ncbi:MAG: hypothetical protein DI551_02635 [Micavibrio aeruginosavorus]|uniref:Uncharacterized protein n=1 Tax=Micavibrio aeruginosavorus TaxID=349221 RepID=A0A2W5N5J9_9BACT|nr:MAG: hypothetical protein DI551_02635 [Micavibrio aeruginosavorus]
MNANETRILSHTSLTSEHAIVSMPKTAWYWLDDLVKAQFPVGGYRALIRDSGKPACPDALSATLRRKAQERCEVRMAEIYSLANDNIPVNGYSDLKSNPSHPSAPDLSARMPSVWQLFRFMPHVTYLTTIWERRNYHLKKR